MTFIGIIPARFASSRFPGKPLAMIGGKPMIQRVYEQARLALDQVLVATDDIRIFEAVRQFGGEVVMTSTQHRSGTDRCWEAYLLSNSNADVVINIQGDEPFVQPAQIEALKRCFPTDIATLVKPYNSDNSLEDLLNPNCVKVVVSSQNEALYFSRSIVPYLRGVPMEEWLNRQQYYKHLGMYAYRADILRKLTCLEQGALEKAESLEQLRWLENGYKIHVAVVEAENIGIDTPADVVLAEQWLKKQEK